MTRTDGYFERTIASAYGERERMVELRYRSEERESYFLVWTLAGTDREPGEPELVECRYTDETEARLAFAREFGIPAPQLR